MALVILPSLLWGGGSVFSQDRADTSDWPIVEPSISKPVELPATSYSLLEFLPLASLSGQSPAFAGTALLFSHRQVAQDARPKESAKALRQPELTQDTTYLAAFRRSLLGRLLLTLGTMTGTAIGGFGLAKKLGCGLSVPYRDCPDATAIAVSGGAILMGSFVAGLILTLTGYGAMEKIELQKYGNNL